MFRKILVANRGEIAVRIVRALQELLVESVAIYATDDQSAPHVAAADASVALGAAGPAAYLDGSRVLAIAQEQGCDAIHPGYGFLSEQADFALACRNAGVQFVGATVEQLSLFGDKSRARALAKQCDVPVLPGTDGPASLAEVRAFFAAQGGDPIMLKAIGGGGGRGIRVVRSESELRTAYESCRREAKAAVGADGIYAERFLEGARHIELQAVGDGQDVIIFGERECTVQRRFQKLVEVAPSPNLPASVRQQLVDATQAMARAVGYLGLGTFEFLVNPSSQNLPFVFMEVNPRLQVEHTVTEEIFDIDLVQMQIKIAAGAALADAGAHVQNPASPTGTAIQWRINAESLRAEGTTVPSSGTLIRFDTPTGPGIRMDTHGYQGAALSPQYDTLLAKLIVYARDGFPAALRRSERALADFHIAGVDSNLPLLRALAARPEFIAWDVDTGWLTRILPDLLDIAEEYADRPVQSDVRGDAVRLAPAQPESPPDAVCAPMPARVIQYAVTRGDRVAAGDDLAVLEAMKMEHVLSAPYAGIVRACLADPDDYLEQGQAILVLEPDDTVTGAKQEETSQEDLDHIRPDLQRVIDRWATTADAARPEVMARRHSLGFRSARENIADLCDEGSFIEYGAFAVAAQSARRSMDELIADTPADGMVTGVGCINRSEFGPERARSVVMSYDATVLAGTQGMRNHAKTDRMLQLALDETLPVVLFAEGGGGRPADTDWYLTIAAGLHVDTFRRYAALDGRVPTVGIAARYCFAGNAALLGCSDVIIATRTSNIGMGGPAMIEGGGLGVFKPTEIGPSSVQYANGVIDVLVEDEAEAVAVARRYLGYFQGVLSDWEAPDPRRLRTIIPENRIRAYDVRKVMTGIADLDSVLMLRTGFGLGIHTALARIQGKPVGIMANNPLHLGGAIDADAADKAARFMQLCNAHGLPIVSLIDTPGFMVGPEAEKSAQVRRVNAMFVASAQLRVPFLAVVLRKAYGLGAMSVAAGNFHRPFFVVSWPTGEFGGMGLEGYVRLGYRKELAAVPEGPQRDELFESLLAERYELGAAIRSATMLEIDAVIDPAQTRDWLVVGLEATACDPRAR